MLHRIIIFLICLMSMNTYSQESGVPLFESFETRIDTVKYEIVEGNYKDTMIVSRVILAKSKDQVASKKEELDSATTVTTYMFNEAVLKHTSFQNPKSRFESLDSVYIIAGEKRFNIMVTRKWGSCDDESQEIFGFIKGGLIVIKKDLQRLYIFDLKNGQLITNGHSLSYNPAVHWRL